LRKEKKERHHVEKGKKGRKEGILASAGYKTLRKGEWVGQLNVEKERKKSQPKFSKEKKRREGKKKGTNLR